MLGYYIQQRDPLMFAGGEEGDVWEKYVETPCMWALTKKNHREKKALKNTKDFIDGDSLIENLLLLNGF